MVMTNARAPAHSAKKAAVRKVGVRARQSTQPEIIIIGPGKTGNPDVEHVFEVAIGKSGKEVEARLANALDKSRETELRLKRFTVRSQKYK